MSTEASSPTPAFDVIVVPGGGVNPDGGLPSISKQRVDYAIELQERESVPLVVSGKWSLFLAQPPLSTEAAAMKAYALSISELMPEDIFTEEKSMESLGNAYFVKHQALEPHGWQHIVLVTSEFHIPRAKYLWGKVLGPSYMVECVAAPSGLKAEELTAKEKLEAKLLDFYRQHLDNVAAGDDKAIQAVLALFPCYSSNAKYSLEELRAIIDEHPAAASMYAPQQ